ncbi:MAG: hypothetical protein SWE60_19545 [Thermodesulfobacteriota bacterium]|nr:hypothetical protein [Thermodesulfobacteriota bacterium]
MDKDVFPLLTVAYYVSKGLTQRQTATIMGKSETMISRLLNRAKELKLLKVTYDFQFPEDFPAAYREDFAAYITHPTLMKRLKKEFDGELRRCTVVPNLSEKSNDGTKSHDSKKGNKEKENHNRLVHIAAAGRIQKILTEGPEEPPSNPEFDRSQWFPTRQNVLVSWGYAVQSVIKNMDTQLKHRISSPSFKDLKVMPLLGNFSVPEATENSMQYDAIVEAYENSVQFSSNTNARQLCAVLDKLPPRPLLTVALLKADEGELCQCAPVFRADQTLMEIYGDWWRDNNQRESLIWNTDTLITSVGGHDRLPEHSPYCYMGYFSNDQPPDNVRGDISGVLFDDQCGQVELHDRQIVGLRLEHIANIAERHRKGLQSHYSFPCGAGVFVVASGGKKALPLSILLEHGMINELITDECTAEAILLEHAKRKNLKETDPSKGKNNVALHVVDVRG